MSKSGTTPKGANTNPPSARQKPKPKTTQLDSWSTKTPSQRRDILVQKMNSSIAFWLAKVKPLVPSKAFEYILKSLDSDQFRLTAKGLIQLSRKDLVSYTVFSFLLRLISEMDFKGKEVIILTLKSMFGAPPVKRVKSLKIRKSGNSVSIENQGSDKQQSIPYDVDLKHFVMDDNLIDCNQAFADINQEDIDGSFALLYHTEIISHYCDVAKDEPNGLMFKIVPSKEGKYYLSDSSDPSLRFDLDVL